MRFVAVLIAALLLTSDAATGQRPSGALTPQIESILRTVLTDASKVAAA